MFSAFCSTILSEFIFKFLGESLGDPGVCECVEGIDPLLWIPLEKGLHEGKEVGIGYSLYQWLRKHAHGVDLTHCWLELSGLFKEDALSAAFDEEGGGRVANGVGNVLYLFMFVLTREEGDADVHFSKDAACTPDVYAGIIGDAECDFWCPVVARLNVGVDGVVLEAAGPEINDLDA